MASSIALSATEYQDNLFKRAARLLPGLLLLAAVGWAGKVIEQSIARYGKAHHMTLPNIEYVLWAILIGLVISNTVGIPAMFRPGLATYEFWLKTGIVLLGSRFILGDVLKLGSVTLVLVAIEITVSLLFMTALGRAFGLSPKLTDLLAIGSSICGVSAIIAAQGAIDADEEDSSYAIAAVLALGAVALFTFPLIGHALGMSDTSYGIWAGLGVDNTAEATAAGALYLRRRRQGRRARQDRAQRHDRFRSTGLRDSLGTQAAYCGRWKQGGVPLAEVSQVRAWLPADFGAGHGQCFQRSAARQSGESFALGVPADVRRSRPAHQHW